MPRLRDRRFGRAGNANYPGISRVTAGDAFLFLTCFEKPPHMAGKRLRAARFPVGKLGIENPEQIDVPAHPRVSKMLCEFVYVETLKGASIHSFPPFPPWGGRGRNRVRFARQALAAAEGSGQAMRNLGCAFSQ